MNKLIPEQQDSTSDNGWGPAHYAALALGIGTLGLGGYKGMGNLLKHKDKLKEYLTQIKHHKDHLIYAKDATKNYLKYTGKSGLPGASANAKLISSLRDIRHYRMGLKEYAKRHASEQSRSFLNTILRSPEIQGGYRAPFVYAKRSAHKRAKAYNKIIDKLLGKNNF